MSNLLEDIGIPAIVCALLYIGAKLQILNDLQITTNKIKANLKVVSDHLVTTNSNFDPKDLQAYSPLKLTEKGKKLIEDTGFEKIFNDHADDFCSYIDSEEPKFKYDVETAATKSISVLYDMDYMSFLKVLFYNHPERNIQNTAPTFGVYIRDKYLERHPEITQ